VIPDGFFRTAFLRPLRENENTISSSLRWQSQANTTQPGT
jgi:hypothetical protein